MNLSPDEDQLIYSYLFEADAVTPVGKLRYGVVCRTSALLPLSAAPSMPSSESGRSSYLTPAALYTCSIFSYDGDSIAYILSLQGRSTISP